MALRVLYLTMNPNRESTTVPTEGWFRTLRSRGLEPIVIATKSGAFPAWTERQGIPTFVMPLPAPDRRRPVLFLRALWNVVAIARRHGVQLVHSNEHDVYPIAQYAARLLSVPVVVSVHFTIDRGYGTWAFGGRRAPERCYFVSRASLDACRPAMTGVVPEERWGVLHNAISLSFYAPDESRRSVFRREHGLESATVVGAACALRPRKQIEHLVAAVAEAADPSMRLLLAGGPVSGDEAYAERLLADARERLGQRLVYVGHLSDLRAFYNALDLFVNTSREEAFGLSVLEAMACGTPVLGYPSVSVGEVILPGGGEIVAQNDLPGLTNSLRRWTADRAVLHTARAQARRRAEYFDIGRISEDLWREYRQLVPDLEYANA
jgi:glycosyltransferase involved in cell wall biosynthesis